MAQSEIVTITAADVKDGKYVGGANVSDLQGSLVIESSLGVVHFASLKVSGYIYAKAGSGIMSNGWMRTGAGWKNRK